MFEQTQGIQPARRADRALQHHIGIKDAVAVAQRKHQLAVVDDLDGSTGGLKRGQQQFFLDANA